MGVNSLPKTVTRQRRGCDLNPGPFCAWVQHANHSATEPPTREIVIIISLCVYRVACNIKLSTVFVACVMQTECTAGVTGVFRWPARPRDPWRTSRHHDARSTASATPPRSSSSRSRLSAQRSSVAKIAARTENPSHTVLKFVKSSRIWPVFWKKIVKIRFEKIYTS